MQAIEISAAKVDQHSTALAAGYRRILTIAAVLFLLFLAFYRLADYPALWFDEGSYLHVPKNWVQLGVYADSSSEGFRYYGPTIGVGPTVLMPVALAFKLFGVGLLQARLVMAVYLTACVLVFYALAFHLGSLLGHEASARRFAWVATALLVASKGIGVIEYGREVLGEVPALFFLAAGLLLWLKGWERSGPGRLLSVGALFGLSAVTKPQELLVLAPAITLAWLANLLYYRNLPQRFFLIPGIVLAAFYAAWQAAAVLYLGPSTAAQNFALLRQATAGAALVFDPTLIAQSLRTLFSADAYLGWLIPALIYGLFFVLNRQKNAQQWSIVLLVVLSNLVWYSLASIGWLRYAFPGIALGSLFVASWISSLTENFRLDKEWLVSFRNNLGQPNAAQLLHGVALVLLAGMIVLPLSGTVTGMLKPGENYAGEMAAYLNKNVPLNQIVETWEPEMGFLTAHDYHYPPNELLNQVIQAVWRNGAPPSDSYHYVEQNNPPYLLIGEFARWVQLYPDAYIELHYQKVVSYGPYTLYQYVH